MWVTAEIGEIKVNSSGHCYLELIENDAKTNIVAKAKATIWSSKYKLIKPFFENSTGVALARGIKILINVSVQYSSLYGFSLQINDINPSYTVGEQELKRQQTISRLKEEGMFGVNSSLEFPMLPRRLAVISAEGAAGFRDFTQHLSNNEFGFNFNLTLFSSPMQGEFAPQGIIDALDAIAMRINEFDLVFIIRGGGAAQDLNFFDDYELALNIAQFPLPIITGVGHDHDHHVADMVCHTSVKTPTAAAAFIIDLFAVEDQLILSFSQRLNSALRTRVELEKRRAKNFYDKIYQSYSMRFQKEEHALELLKARINAANPASSLERGYSMLYYHGKRVTDINLLKSGDDLTVLMRGGRVLCKIDKIETN